MAEPRSGDQVKGTVLTSGLVTSLLAPWVHLAIIRVEAVTGAELGTNYEAQLLAAITVGVAFAAAHWRMNQIKKDDPQEST